MNTPKNLDEAMPIQPVVIEIEATADAIKYLIKIFTTQEKLNLSTSYKKGLLIQEYFSSYDLKQLLENQHFAFKTINDYFLFLKDIIDNNKLIKSEPKLKKIDKTLYLEIPAKLGIIKELKFQIEEKELTEKEMQKNVMDFVNIFCTCITVVDLSTAES